MKKISILIATYNRWESLSQTMESLFHLKQPDGWDVDVIVADNNSTDRTRETVERFQGRKWPVRYVFEARQGKTFALNKGLSLAAGELIFMTDDDCLPHQDWLGEGVKVFEQYPQADMVTGKVVPYLGVPEPAWLDLKDKIFWGPFAAYDLGDEVMDSSQTVLRPPGCNMIVRRSSLDRFGGFAFPGRAQDTEMTQRWVEQGARIVYSPRVIIYHQIEDERVTKRYMRRWQFACGKESGRIYYHTYAIGRTVGGFPLWAVRRFLVAVLKWVKALPARRKEAFARELWVFHYAGFLRGLRQMRGRPKRGAAS